MKLDNLKTVLYLLEHGFGAAEFQYEDGASGLYVFHDAAISFAKQSSLNWQLKYAWIMEPEKRITIFTHGNFSFSIQLPLKTEDYEVLFRKLPDELSWLLINCPGCSAITYAQGILS